MPFHEFDDLRLHGDVESSGGFIGDQQIWLRDQRHRDHHALAHAAGEFMRITADALDGVLNADILQGLDAQLDRALSLDLLVNQQRFDQLIFDAQIRIQRRHRVLENHGDAFAADAIRIA